MKMVGASRCRRKAFAAALSTADSAAQQVAPPGAWAATPGGAASPDGKDQFTAMPATVSGRPGNAPIGVSEPSDSICHAWMLLEVMSMAYR